MKQNVGRLLEEKYKLYNRDSFIENDPVSIPHRFTRKEDIEIAGFLAAAVSWGQRKAIIAGALKMMQAMDNAPYSFIINADKHALYDASRKFTYRTFQPDDALFFLTSLQNIYRNRGGMEAAFYEGYQPNRSIKEALSRFREIFFEIPSLQRTQKHLANVNKGSSAKRLNMFLRWMVRKDNCGVDFGIWPNISMSDLKLPLDVHTGNVSRALGLLTRKQDDWKAVEEISEALKQFAPEDPVKYDFSLFGLGIYEGVK